MLAVLVALVTIAIGPNLMTDVYSSRTQGDATVYWTFQYEDKTHNYLSRYVNGNLLVVNSGDENGLQHPHKIGEEGAYYTRAMWTDNGKVFESMNINTVMYELNNTERMFDVLAADLHYQIPTYKKTTSQLRATDVIQVGDQLTTASGSLIWGLDAASGAIVSCETTLSGKIVAGSYTTLGDNGFPERIAYYRDNQLQGEVIIHYVELNQPGDKSATVWNFIEFLDGQQLVYLDNRRVSWNGDGFTNTNEWLKHNSPEVIVERADYLESIEYGARKNPDPPTGFRNLETVRYNPGLWVEYVASFVRKHKLEGKPEGKECWKLLERVQEPAKDYLKRKKEQIVKVRNDIQTGQGSEKECEVSKAKLKDLLGPVGVIFEKELVAGLERIAR